MTVGQWVLLASVLLVAAYGVWRARTEGAFRGGRRAGDADHTDHTDHTALDPPADPTGLDVASLLREQGVEVATGARATLVQFSSAFCAPCRATRQVLGDVASATPGVSHVEVDAEHHLEVVRRLNVLRTPTTLVLDAHGREAARAAGAPRREQVLAALPSAVSE